MAVAVSVKTSILFHTSFSFSSLTECLADAMNKRGLHIKGVKMSFSFDQDYSSNTNYPFCLPSVSWPLIQVVLESRGFNPSLRISPKAYVEEHLQSQWNVSSIRVKEQGGIRRHRYILSKRYILTSTILCNRGSNQPTLHSQWLSRNVNIVLVAAFAPLTRDRINPGKKCQSLIQVSKQRRPGVFF